MMELFEEELSELLLFGVNYQPNSFKRKEFESKRVLYYNGFNKENKESEKYCEFTIFDDDTYKQPERGNKNAREKKKKPKKTSPKSRTKEAVMGKEIPMADYLYTVRNITHIVIMNACSFLLMCEELIERRAALRQVFGEKVPHRMKIAIINKSDESNSKLDEWRTKLEGNNIEIIDLQKSDYEILLKNPVELTGDFWRKGRKGDMLELLKLRGEINQVHEEENPDGEEITDEEIVALMGISVRRLEPMTEEEGANNDIDIHVNKGPPRQDEDVSLPKRREDASTESEPALDMTSQKACLDEEGTQDFGITFRDELGLKEDDDAENVVDLKERSVSNRENVEDRNETNESVSEDILQKVNLHKGAAPIHQAHLSKNFILILHALVNYVRLHAMNAFIVPGSHSVRNPIWTSEVYVIIRIFENGEEIIRRLFKNKKRQHAEDVCLEALKDLMKDKNTVNWHMMMYVSYSPCYECSPKIIKFIEEKNISLDLRFHTLFQMNRESCKRNNCNCMKQKNHDQNKKELIHMKHNPQIDSIWIVAADERRELSEVLQLNLSEAILEKLNQLKYKDGIEMESDAKDLGILKDFDDDSEDDVPDNLDILSKAVAMNFVHRPEDWHRKNNTPEAETTTVTTREAHPAGDYLQREEDKLVRQLEELKLAEVGQKPTIKKFGVDLVGGISGRPVTEDGVNNKLKGEGHTEGDDGRSG